MHKIFLLFLFLTLPVSADAADIFNNTDSFDIAKAVKLGRGKAYSVAADSGLNTGTGKTEIAKSCSSGCSDCDTSTGWCDACQSRYVKDNAGKCHSCPSNCASCLWEYGNTVSCETCDSGYELATNSSTGAGPFYCKKTETICLAGTYVSGTSCVDCPDGTYSTGSNAASCQSCSTLTITESGSNISCGSSCTTTGECTSCPYGYYRPKTATVLTCNKCRTGCSACSDSSMGVYCTACESGYTYTLDSYNMGSCASSSSGSNTESDAVTCSAGYYVSGSSCVACSEGTYSKGGTATSCSSCTTLYTSAGSNTCTSCTTDGTCTGSNSGSSSSSSSSGGSTCNSGGATAARPTNCPQGYGWGGSGCVTSSSQCKVCSQGSSLGGYCNCPAGSPSDGRGGCGTSCSQPYTNYCSSGVQSGKCCRNSSDCYSSNTGNCR